MGRFFISRRWRVIKLVWLLFAVEFGFTIPALALFAIAQPNTYRTRLWQDGFDNKFNSNPMEQIYSMVNRTPYHVPTPFRQFLTDFNVVISVLSMFLLLVKGVMFIMHVFFPIVGVFVHGILVALWAYSLNMQASPDNSDPRFPKLSAPWYITKGCSVAHNPNNVQYCKQAKAALSVTVIMLSLFLANTILAIYSMIPSKTERIARMTRIEETEQKNSMRFEPPPTTSKQRHWTAHEQSWAATEQQQSNMSGGLAPPTPGSMGGMKSPTTPRTRAFQRLGGSNDLPLRDRQ